MRRVLALVLAAVLAPEVLAADARAVARPAASPAALPASTPEQAIRSLLRVFSGPRGRLGAACELLTEDTRLAYTSDGLTCAETVAYQLLNDEDGGRPEHRRSTLGRVQVARRPDPAALWQVVPGTQPYRWGVRLAPRSA